MEPDFKGKNDLMVTPKDDDTLRNLKMRRKRGIVLCYCRQCDFKQISFVLELANQLDEMGFAQGLWLDLNEIELANFEGPIAHTLRLEAVEKCKAAIFVLTSSVLKCTWCLGMLNTLRIKREKRPSLSVFGIRLSGISDISAFHGLSDFSPGCYADLSTQQLCNLSATEKAVVALQTLVEKLNCYASEQGTGKTEDSVERCVATYKANIVLTWSNTDVLAWLKTLSVSETSIMLFEEQAIHGFHLPYLNNTILQDVFLIESKAVRRRVLSSLATIQAQTTVSCQWFTYTKQRGKMGNLYLICDPHDKTLANLLKSDLQKRGIKVLFHTQLGDSREEFLLHSAPLLARCSVCAVLLTKAANSSPFVYHEVILALWLQRRVISLLFQPMLNEMRMCLRGFLGTRGAIDFHSKIYTDALQILLHEVQGERSSQAIIYEPSFLRFLGESVKLLEQFDVQGSGSFNRRIQNHVYFSYHWSDQSQVSWLMSYLNSHDISGSSDMSFVTSSLQADLHKHCSPLCLTESTRTLGRKLESAIADATVIVLCVSRRYLASSDRVQEVRLAESLSKPMVAVLLEYTVWPPVNIDLDLRKMLIQINSYDISTKTTLSRNLARITKELKTSLENAPKRL